MPSGLHTFFAPLYRLGAIWAVAVLVVTVLAFRRWRLARDLALAGGLAWILGRLMGIVDQGGLAKWSDVFRAATTPTLPALSTARSGTWPGMSTWMTGAGLKAADGHMAPRRPA